MNGARHPAVVAAFMIRAAALLGGVAACFASAAAVRHRGGVQALYPLWDWSRALKKA